jgi:conjugative relaxase-like TrwC/TraI family protein
LLDRAAHANAIARSPTARRDRRPGVVAVMSVAMLGGGADRAGYYLERSAACHPVGYYLDEVEPPGRWCGHGAQALGLDGPVTGEIQAATFAGLLDGQLPNGTVVAKPVMRTDPRSLLPAAPLADALRRQLTDTGLTIEQLVTDPKLAKSAAKLLDRTEPSTSAATNGKPVTVDVRVVADLTAALAVNPHVLYPPTRAKGGGKTGFTAAFRHAGQKVDIRRSALDLVVSAPKSVSVLFALADPATAAAVSAAHQVAVTEALGYLDRHTSHGLRGHQGENQRATRVPTDGLVAAAFTHHTSRADDPQLHTHLVVANLVHGTDGKWSAVDSRAVHLHARTAGCVYQAVLRGELTRTLGVEWGPVTRGVAEIRGIPKSLRREFSTRRKDIEGELDRTGATGRKAAQRAAYVTRPAKSHTPEQPLRQLWAQRATDRGHPADDVLDRTLGRGPAPNLPALRAVAVELFGPGGVTGRATSFDRRDLIQTLTETLPPGVPVTGLQLEAATDRLLADNDAVPLLDPAERDGERRWSTRELLTAEHTALTLADQPTRIRPLTVEWANAVTDGSALSTEQAAVVTGLLTSPHLVDVMVGPAGSGKTAALRTAADTWQAGHVPVIGCALAAVTARRLETATRVECSSITRLLGRLERTDPATGQPAGLPDQCVVLLDEASMVGTRHLTQLLTHVHAAGGKLVLVGDPHQLGEIDAGGMFTALAAQRTPLSLTGNQRQSDPAEQAALVQLRDGHIDQALEYYVTNDRVHLSISTSQARQALAADYLTHRDANADPYAVVALASTREHAAALNAEIRRQLRAAERLGPDTTSDATNSGTDQMGYAPGDLVIVTRNDHQVGLLNGTRATLASATPEQLTLRTDTGEQVTVPTSWAGEHLDHGYAMTVHKAQGLTTSVALLYGTSTLTQQAGYVALSRGTSANHLYTSAASLHAATNTTENNPARFELLEPDPADITRRLAERLGVTRRQVLARDQRPTWRPAPARPRPRLGPDYPHPRPGRDHGRDFGPSR